MVDPGSGVTIKLLLGGFSTGRETCGVVRTPGVAGLSVFARASTDDAAAVGTQTAVDAIVVGRKRSPTLSAARFDLAGTVALDADGFAVSGLSEGKSAEEDDRGEQNVDLHGKTSFSEKVSLRGRMVG
jgi:hypothetical protein